MSDPIFVEPPEDAERPVYRLGNPVRVDRPGDPQNPARLDLVALANAIVARETECRQLRDTVRHLTDDARDMRTRIERLEAELVHGKLGRIVSVVSDILAEDDD
jgi:hypothetical protein